MSPLYLECALCGRKQAEGLLSRAAWGYLEREGHPPLRACPNCKTAYADWETRVVSAVNGRVAGVVRPPEDQNRAR